MSFRANQYSSSCFYVRLHRDFSFIMENLLTDHSNTNENPTVIDEARKQEASECLLILLSLALSCTRKLKV